MPAKKQDEILQTEPLPKKVIDPSRPARQTKQALLLELIGRIAGATLEELTSATGWLPHTTRAAITGLRKRGHDVRCERVDGVSRYVIGSGAQ